MTNEAVRQVRQVYSSRVGGGGGGLQMQRDRGRGGTQSMETNGI